MPAEKNVTELLTQKRDFLTNILNTTKSFAFTGKDEEDIIGFVEMIEKRQPAFEKIQAIDASLKETDHAIIIEQATGELLGKITNLNEQIKDQASQIIALDKKNQEEVEKSKTALAKEMNNIKKGKNLNSAYHQGAESVHTRFDKSK